MLEPLLLGELLDPLLLEPLLLGVELEPLLLGEALEPPLLELDLKYASHSERDTCPSLSLSTLVNSGMELDAPLELLLGLEELPLELLGVDELLLGLEELPLAPLELLPVALGDLSLPEAPVEDEPELCAMDTLANAKSAAAVAVVINFNFIR